MRLIELTKLVQHPLISCYIRCYLCRVSMRLNAADKSPHWKCLNDWMQTYTHQPSSLLWPALEYVIQCVAFNAVSYDDLLPLWEYARLPEKRSTILIQMLNALPAMYLGEHAMEACRIVVGSEAVTGDELCILGNNLLRTEIAEESRKRILKAVWKCVSRLQSLKMFIACCDSWIEFVVKYFTNSELYIVLEKLLQKILPDKKYLHYYSVLISIQSKIFANTSNVSALLQIDVVNKFIGIFREDSNRRSSSEIILTAFINKHDIGSFSDIVLANQILEFSKQFSSSFDLSVPPDQMESASNLLRSALDRFALNSSPQQALDFLVDCRVAFLSNDQLQQYVIQRMIGLTLHIIRSAKFSTSRSSFLKACLANLFVTIPSLCDPVQRLKASLQSLQLAISSFTFFYVDVFFEFAIETFRQLLNTENSHYILSLGTYFLAILLNLPDQSDSISDLSGNSSLAILNRFLEVVSNSDFAVQPDKARILMRCLQFVLVKWSRSYEQIEEENAFYRVLVSRIIKDSLQTILTQQTEITQLICLEFVELISLFSPNDPQKALSDEVMIEVRNAYKRCKNNESFQNRLKLLNK